MAAGGEDGLLVARPRQQAAVIAVQPQLVEQIAQERGIDGSIDRGEPPLSPSIARRMLEYFAKQAAPVADAQSEVLTARELDVLRLLGRGLRINEAARVLGIAHSTVAGYVKAIYRKLNIASRAEAAIEAVRRGLV